MELIINEQLQFLRLSEVLKLIPISRSSWYLGQKSGRFPMPCRLGPRTSAYPVTVIKKLAEQITGGNAEIKFDEVKYN